MENSQSTSLNGRRIENRRNLGSYNQINKSDLSDSMRQISKRPVSAIENRSKANSNVICISSDSDTDEDTKNTTLKSSFKSKDGTSSVLEPRATGSHTRAGHSSFVQDEVQTPGDNLLEDNKDNSNEKINEMSRKISANFDLNSDPQTLVATVYNCLLTKSKGKPKLSDFLNPYSCKDAIMIRSKSQHLSNKLTTYNGKQVRAIEIKSGNNQRTDIVSVNQGDSSISESHPTIAAFDTLAQTTRVQQNSFTSNEIKDIKETMTTNQEVNLLKENSCQLQGVISDVMDRSYLDSLASHKTTDLDNVPITDDFERTSNKDRKNKVEDERKKIEEEEQKRIENIDKEDKEKESIAKFNDFNAAFRKEFESNHNSLINTRAEVKKEIFEEVEDEDYITNPVNMKKELSEYNEYSEYDEYNGYNNGCNNDYNYEYYNSEFQRQSIEEQCKKITETEKRKAFKGITSKSTEVIMTAMTRGLKVEEKLKESNVPKNVSTKLQPKLKSSGSSSSSANPTSVQNPLVPSYEYKIQSRNTDDCSKVNSTSNNLYDNDNNRDITINSSIIVRKENLNLEVIGNPKTHTRSSSPKQTTILETRSSEQDQENGAPIILKETIGTRTMVSTSTHPSQPTTSSIIPPKTNLIAKTEDLNIKVIGIQKNNTSFSSFKPKTTLETISSKRHQDTSAAIVPKKSVATRTIVSTSKHPNYQTTRLISSRNTILNQQTFNDNNDGKTLNTPVIMLTTGEILLQRSDNNFIKEQDIKPTHNQRQKQNVTKSLLEKQPPKKRGRNPRTEMENNKLQEYGTYNQNQSITTKELERQPPKKRGRKPRTEMENKKLQEYGTYNQNQSITTKELERQPPKKRGRKPRTEMENKKLQEYGKNNTTSQNVGIIDTPIKEVESQAKVTRRSLRLISKQDSVNKQFSYAQQHSATSSLYKKPLEEKTYNKNKNIITIELERQPGQPGEILLQRSDNNFVKEQDIKPTHNQRQKQNVTKSLLEKQPPKKRGRNPRTEMENNKLQEYETYNQNQSITTKELERQPPKKRGRKPRTEMENKKLQEYGTYNQNQSITTKELERQPPKKRGRKPRTEMENKKLQEYGKNNTTSQNVGIIDTPIKEVESQAKVTRRSLRLISKQDSVNKQFSYAQQHSATSSLFKKTT